MTAAVPTKAGKVLLIDDDDLIAGSLRQYLARQGCDVDVAVEQTSAAKLMRAQPYRVIIVDPFLTGGVHHLSTALIDDIALLQPEASVMVVTGYGSPELSQLATSARLPILVKPQSVVTLGELIVGALTGSPQLSSQGLKE
jgi:DNA-binding NtrC family response regulator